MADQLTVPKWIEQVFERYASFNAQMFLGHLKFDLATAYREFVREKAKEIAESLDHYTFVDEKAKDVEAIILHAMEASDA